MIGDVNIFLNGVPGEPDFEAEAEIMIAGELTLRNIYVPSPAHLFAVSKLMTRHTIFFYTLRTRLSPTRTRKPCSAAYVFVRHHTLF